MLANFIGNELMVPWQAQKLVGCPCGALIAASCPGNIPDSAWQVLHSAERNHCAQLPPHRRREWLSGRLCLRAALSLVGNADVPLLSQPSGAPAIPEGISGSISHKRVYAVALAKSGSPGVGIDLERVEPVSPKLLRRVLTRNEQDRLNVGLGSISQLDFTVHFAIKEALYKSSDTRTQSDIDFHDVEVLVPTWNAMEWSSITASIFGKRYPGRIALFANDHWVLAAAARTSLSP